MRRVPLAERLFWQIPLIVMSLNGGLWFAVASLNLTSLAKSGVLGFAAIADLLMIWALIRLRDLMQVLLDRIHASEGVAPDRNSRVVLFIFCSLFFLAAIGAGVAACHGSILFKSRETSPPAVCVVLLPDTATETTSVECQPGAAP